MIKKLYSKTKSAVKGAVTMAKRAATSVKGIIGAGSGVIGSATTALDVPSIDPDRLIKS